MGGTVVSAGPSAARHRHRNNRRRTLGEDTFAGAGTTQDERFDMMWTHTTDTAGAGMLDSMFEAMAPFIEDAGNPAVSGVRIYPGAGPLAVEVLTGAGS